MPWTIVDAVKLVAVHALLIIAVPTAVRLQKLQTIPPVFVIAWKLFIVIINYHHHHHLSYARFIYFFQPKKTKKQLTFIAQDHHILTFFNEFNNLIDVKYLKAVAKVKKGLILHCLLAWVQWSFIMDSRLSPFTRHHHRGVTGRRRRRGQTFRHC